ncbi:MAG TPA: retroviral-like aspartic protease family protein [Allosphingosinicella sp.]|nr:retroviral-like aspartic protease family protein [Allosphingosinicella sp.]
MRNGPSALIMAGLGAALMAAAPSHGQEAPAPAPASPVPNIVDPAPAAADLQQAETLGLTDQDTRMTVQVSIGGQGPFAFIVDTGAERTVISRELARALELAPGRTTTVHSMSEVSEIETVVIPSLRIGSRSVTGIHAPALARANLGASGMLGVDSLQTQRVLFDFGRREMTITPSRRREERWPEGTIVVTGRRLLGRLVLVDASFDGQRIWVVIDTGSEISVGNSRLRTALQRSGRLGLMAPIRMMSVTGGVVDAEYTIARRIRIGGVDIRDLPVAFHDAHPFQHLGLSDRPALLLGMDALRLFDRVSVDFANRRVRVLLDDGALFGAEPRMAGEPPVRTAS